MRHWIPAGLLVLLAAAQADAGLLFAFEERGPDVVVIAGGSLNFAGLQSNLGSNVPGIAPSSALVVTGPTLIGKADIYPVFAAGPASFGAGTGALASFSSGDGAGFDGPNFNGPGLTFIGVTAGYRSDAPIASSSTYLNSTFATLGLTPGTYVYTYSGIRGGTPLDTITVQIGPVSVPEPSSGLMCAIAGLGGVIVRSARARAR